VTPRHVAALAICVTALALGGCSRGEGDQSKAKGPRPPAVPVTAAAVEARDVPVQIQGIGNVQAAATVSVYSLLSGQIFKVHFPEGQEVKTGELLFSIDPRPFESALQQAQATMAQHQAAVAQAEANLARDQAQADNARVEEERYKKLVQGGLIAREQYDQILTAHKSALATVDADRAMVTNQKALVQADAAAVDNAKVQLSYTAIRAPIEGRTGNLLIHQGNVVKANDIGNPLVIINRVHPINVVFAVPERFLDDIKAARALGPLAVEATPQGRTVIARGTLSFVNNAVDTTTGTIQLKATFDNTDNALWPGQFATVTLTVRTESRALVVPSQAIQAGQQGQYVFVVKPDSTVESRPVVVAFANGPITIIRTGVQAGERVVTDGQMRLVPGTRVDVKPASPTAPAAPAGPAPSAAPAPATTSPAPAKK
jgi:membrane fusion protein, multidrug efflux system